MNEYSISNENTWLDETYNDNNIYTLGNQTFEMLPKIMRIESVSGCQHWKGCCKMDSLSPPLRWKSRQYSIWDTVSTFSSCCYDWTLNIPKHRTAIIEWKRELRTFQNGPVWEHRTSTITWRHDAQCCDENSTSITIDVKAAKPHVQMCYTVFGWTKRFVYDIYLWKVMIIRNIPCYLFAKCGDCD